MPAKGILHSVVALQMPTVESPFGEYGTHLRI